MNERHPTTETEVISGEDWCTHCKQDVQEWNVFFETSYDSDSGYDKIRRCPHCHERCFADGSESVGCIVFYLAFFGAAGWIPLLEQMGTKINIDNWGGLLVILMIAHGLIACLLVNWIWKSLLYRQRYTKSPHDPENVFSMEDDQASEKDPGIELNPYLDARESQQW